MGASIGSDTFRVKYATEKVSSWCEEVEKLAEFAKSQPQAAFAAFVHGEQHKFGYFMRTIPFMEEFMEPLDRIINDKLLPAILGTTFSEEERNMFSLPIRLGGLGIPVFNDKAPEEYGNSLRLTAPLVSIMVLQGDTLPDKPEAKQIRADHQQRAKAILNQKSLVTEEMLPEVTKRAVQHAKEKGASSWLSVLPL